MRSKVEHVFEVMKLKFGFVKVRYRGLEKNANRLFATCALVNCSAAEKTARRGVSSSGFARMRGCNRPLLTHTRTNSAVS